MKDEIANRKAGAQGNDNQPETEEAFERAGPPSHPQCRSLDIQYRPTSDYVHEGDTCKYRMRPVITTWTGPGSTEGNVRQRIACVEAHHNLGRIQCLSKLFSLTYLTET